MAPLLLRSPTGVEQARERQELTAIAAFRGCTRAPARGPSAAPAPAGTEPPSAPTQSPEQKQACDPVLPARRA